LRFKTLEAQKIMDTGTLILALMPIIVISLGLEIFALIDLIRRDPREIQGGNKWVWAALIVLVSTIGSIVYLVAGRNRTVRE
jgi:hypothetical protein